MPITRTSANRRLLLIRLGASRFILNERRAEILSEARRDPHTSEPLRLKSDQINSAFL